MKPERPTGERLVLRMSRREGDLFERTLRMYPVLSTNDLKLTRQGGLPDEENSRQLLEEALAEQREENRKLVQDFLQDAKQFARTQQGVRLELAESQVEWLLQVLNDVRVGCWVRLGCPEDKRLRLAISAGLMNPGKAQHFWAMEVAGYFQMRLLSRLHPEE